MFLFILSLGVFAIAYKYNALYPMTVWVSLIWVFYGIRYFFTKKQLASSKNMTQELDMAKRVQQAMLSVDIDPPAGLKIAKKCLPAQSVGGDFYTFIQKNESHLTSRPKQPGVIEYIDKRHTYFGVCMGDVAGHGVSSALVMALASGIITEIGLGNKSPGEVFEKVNEALKGYIEQSQIRYVTAVYAVINLDSQELRFASAGHPAGILQRNTGEIILLKPEGVFLGMFGNETYEETVITLNTGDRVFLYTDGLLEPFNDQQEEFGMERLIECISYYKDYDINDAIDKIFEDVAAFSKHPRRDDQTMLIIEATDKKST